MSRLDDAIESRRLQIRSDGYAMSIGELANLYQNGELEIQPEFQRRLRWNHRRKVSFIESVLLQFPLPSIFVATRPDGVWSLVDGLQRITTIFEFMGILKLEDGSHAEQLKLLGTEQLPELDGLVFGYQGDDADDASLSLMRRMDFRRQKVDVKILLRESNEEMVYELFTRLNNGGSALTKQDVRSAIMSRVELAFYKWFEGLASYRPFVNALALSKRELDDRYDRELLLEFLLFAEMSDEAIGVAASEDVDTFLDKSVRSGLLYDLDREKAQTRFYETFALLDTTLGSSAFREPVNGVVRAFQPDAYLALTLGLATAIDAGNGKVAIGKTMEYWANRNDDRANVAAAVRIGRALLNG